MVDPNRLEGHSLPNVGKVTRFGYLSDGYGFATCTCGAISPELESTTQRKRWHRRHKEIIRAAQLAADPLVDATVGSDRQP